MFALIDLVLSFLGFIIAIFVAIPIVGGGLAMIILPLNQGVNFKNFLRSCLGAVGFALTVTIGWRIFRFAGGYIGSSEYPLHHVVRFIGGLFG